MYSMVDVAKHSEVYVDYRDVRYASKKVDVT